MSTSRNSGHPRGWATALLALVVAAIPQVGVAAPVTWQSWTFDYDISGSMDGLSLRNVTFQGRPLITKLSFPVMRVFYDSDACGPYADRLGGTLSPIPWANNATLAQRQFTLNGQQWYEIGIRDQIGSYDIYQVYYLGADGTIDAHIYSKGLQCVVNHIHYPDWRIDFGLDGAAGDQILGDSGSGFVVLTQEFDANASSAINHAWRVRDATTGLSVDVLPGFPDFVIPDGSTTVPVTTYSNNTVFGRVYRSTEDTGWTYGPNTQVPFGNGEGIATADTVLWYEGYLPHSSSDGSALWHSTGVRLVANLNGTPPPPPPPGSDGTSFIGGVVSILDNQPGSPYPSTVNVTNLGGTITKVTVRLDGFSHTYPDDVDLALVGPGGQAVMLMSDAGGSGGVNGVSLTFDSSAFVAIPSVSQISGGVFRPANYGDTADAFAAPAPGGTYGTSLDVFNGLVPNGTWRLYVVDDGGIDVGAIGSWVLTIATSSTTPPPADTTPDAFTLTDVIGAVTSTPQISSPVTITGINTPTPIGVVGGEYSIGCGATFTAVAGTVSNGQTVCVRHTSAASYATSTNTTLTVGGVGDTFTSTTLAAPPPPGTGQTQSFTGGVVSILDNQPGSPYPSTVNVTNLGGTITKVTVRLDGFRHTYPDDVDLALVGPGGQAVMLMSDAGGSGGVNGVSLTFDSSAFLAIPYASQISSGVFRPANYGGTADAFAAPAPGGTYGTSLDVFNGLAPNGTWRLYVVDDGGIDVGAIGSWVLTIATSSTTPPPTDSTPDAFTFTDVIGANPGTFQISNPVTITGINTAVPISVAGGEYSIACGATFTAVAATISNGQTVCVRHTSAASYATSTNTTLTVGGVGDTFTSTTLAAPPPPGTGQTQSFSGGVVSILDNQPGSPYPSTVNVTNMSGTITKVTVRLDGFRHTYPDDVDLALVGPGGQAIMLMSDAGGSGDLNGVSLTFDSTASATLPNSSQISGGVFRPANYGASDPFAAPAPGGTYGTSLGVFNGLAPNGTWRLYVVDDQGVDVGAIGTGWLLTITTL